MLSFLNEDYAKVTSHTSFGPSSVLAYASLGRARAYARILPLPHRGTSQSRVSWLFTSNPLFLTCVPRRILTCLIPLRILRGHLPSTELMRRFAVLDELFSPFVAAIRTGDISAYDAALERWEHRLVELNLWITIEKARELCIRGLFRRVYVSSNSDLACTPLICVGADGLLLKKVHEFQCRCSTVRFDYRATTSLWRRPSVLWQI